MTAIKYGPFDGRSRSFLFALIFALLAIVLLGAAVTLWRTEIIECARPPGGKVGSCEIRRIYPLIPVSSDRFESNTVAEVRYHDETSSKGSSIVGGETLIFLGDGNTLRFGSTTVEEARRNTEQIDLFLQGKGGSTLRIEVIPSRWSAAWVALFGIPALGFTIALVVRGCRDLGLYRIEVHVEPRERKAIAAARPLDPYRVDAQDDANTRARLRVTRTVLGISLRTHVIGVPRDVSEVAFEQGSVSVWLLARGQAPPRGGRLVLRTATGARVPIIPALRQGVEVHERARIALAKALGLPAT